MATKRKSEAPCILPFVRPEPKPDYKSATFASRYDTDFDGLLDTTLLIWSTAKWMAIPEANRPKYALYSPEFEAYVILKQLEDAERVPRKVIEG